MASKFSRLQSGGRIFWVAITLVVAVVLFVYRDHIFPPKPAPSAVKEEVKEVVDVSVPIPGVVNIQTVPAGIKVFIDGELKGVTPLHIAGMKTGSHVLTLSKSCYRLQKHEFIFADDVVSLQYTMDSICGDLQVESAPTGSTVIINGKKRGKTPYTMTGVRIGDLDLRVRQGLSERQRTIKIRKGHTSRETFDFRRPTHPEHRATWQDPHTGMTFVWVKGGCFLMGNPQSDKLLKKMAEREKHKVSSFFKSVFDVVTDSGEEQEERGYDIDEAPVHEVCLDGLWVGQKEVTNGQYLLFSKATGIKPEWSREENEYNVETGENEYYKTLGGESLTAKNNPVVGVSWRDVSAFGQWFTAETGYASRLLTEAEWEYVCRSGGHDEEFSGGEADDVAWYVDNSDGESHGVGLLQANGLGVFDLSGNVWEWTCDEYHPEAYANHAQFNPVQESGIGDRRKVVRGGSWRSKQKSLRCTARYGLPADDTNVFLGFRIVMTGGENKK